MNCYFVNSIESIILISGIYLLESLFNYLQWNMQPIMVTIDIFICQYLLKLVTL